MDFIEIRKLYDIWDNSFGISEAEIIECERMLGKKLPQTLREYYLQFGKNEEIHQNHDHLVLPAELEILDDGFVVFYCENQYVYLAGIKFGEFENDNPDVYKTYDRENWEINLGALDNFLTSQAYLNSLFSFPYTAIAFDIGSEMEKYIRTNWNKLKITSVLPGTDFFQNSKDEILGLMRGKDEIELYIASREKRLFLKLLEQFDVDWSYNSLLDD